MIFCSHTQGVAGVALGYVVPAFQAENRSFPELPSFSFILGLEPTISIDGHE